MKIVRHGVAAVETIAFKNDIFFKQLTSVVGEALGAKGSLAAFEDEASKMVQDCFGLEINVKFVTDHAPSIEIPDIDRNHPLLDSMRRNTMQNADSRKMLKNAADGVLQGSVNILTGKVTGVFSKVAKTMHMPIKQMANLYNMSAEEIAAAMLHEIGHVFTYCEYVSRFASTNQVLTAVVRAMDGSDNAAERKVIFKEVAKNYRIAEDEIERISDSTSKESVVTVLLIAEVQTSRSELGTNIYDCNNWEQLADQFASRFGAGRYLVTGLAKLYESNVSARGWFKFLAMEAVKLFLLGGTLASMFLSPALVPTGLYLMLMGWIWCLLDGPFDPTYDRPGARLRRIRNDLVERLKTSKTETPESTKAIQRDLEVIDEQLKNIQDKLPLYYVVYKVFNKNFRSRMKAESIQQELEALVSNDLFVHSSKLQ